MCPDEGASSKLDRLLTAGVDIGVRAVKVAVLAHGARRGFPRVLASEIVSVAGRHHPGDAQLAVREGWWRSLRSAGLTPADIALVASTGQAWAVLAQVGHFYRSAGLTTGVRFLFPGAVAVLDIGARQIRCTRMETAILGRGYVATPPGECWGSDLLVTLLRSTAAYDGLAARASDLVGVLSIDGPVAIAGAVASDPTFLGILARQLSDARSKAVLLSSSEGVFAGAYGAALLAARRFRRATIARRQQQSEAPPLPPASLRRPFLN